MVTNFDLGELVYVYRGENTDLTSARITGIYITADGGEQYTIAGYVNEQPARNIYRHSLKLLERLKADATAEYEERIAWLDEQRKKQKNER